MKRIGLITFHASDNCGSMLQTYALQYVLEKKYGQYVEIINFSNDKQHEMYSIFVKVRRLRDVLRNVLRLILYPSLKKEQDGFRKFWKYYNLSKKSYRSNIELKELDWKYDTVVCGSDQIWNFQTGDYDDAYVLNFLNKTPKVAYAVSLGQAKLNDTSEHKEKYRNLLSDFKAISVREFKSQPLVQSLSKVNVDICLDPTFLISPDVYYNIMPEKRLIKEKYIFCYAFYYHKQFCDNVLELSKRLNLPVYMMDRKQYYIKRVFSTGIKLTPFAGPEAFLNIFKFADMIFTTSFHGTAFSVIFKKKFWYLNETGGEGDGRATSLLRQMNLMQRYVTPTEIKQKKNLWEEINFIDVYNNLEMLRKHSFEFIEENIIK